MPSSLAIAPVFIPSLPPTVFEIPIDIIQIPRYGKTILSAVRLTISEHRMSAEDCYIHYIHAYDPHYVKSGKLHADSFPIGRTLRTELLQSFSESYAAWF